MSKPKAAPKRKMPSPKAAPARVASSAGKGKKPAAQAPKPKRSIPVVGIIFGVIAVLLVAAVTLTGNTGPDGEFGEPAISGENLPPFQRTASDPAIGQSAPVAVGEDFAGQPVTIGEAGTPTAIVFLAHWCPHCQAEVPQVQAWLDAGGGVEGVAIKSVATSSNSARDNYPPSAWLEREGWSSEVLLDDSDNSVWQSYGAGGFPYWVFLNGDGTVAARNSGRLDIATLEQFLLALAS